MRGWPVLLCLVLPACQSILPDDHILRTKLSSSVGDLAKALDPREPLQKAVARIGSMKTTTINLMPWENGRLRQFSQVPHQIVALGDHEVSGIRPMADQAVALTKYEVDGVERIAQPGSTTRHILSPDRAATRLRRGIDETPRSLGLDRQILPSPTDRNRQTGIVYEVRQESFVERLLRRIPKF